jgi:cytochrome c oxidase subunit 3
MSLLRKVMAKPWEHAGELEGLHGEFVTTRSASKTGLLMFLAVISSMFLLFMISYYTRSLFPDWEVLADPGILWVNTAILALASLAMQMASNAAKRDAAAGMRNYLLAGAVLTLVFIGGQWIAWEQLIENGFYAQANPAIAFFYLVTGLHALHLVGGMWFLARLGLRLSREKKRESARHSVTLCATYWHYLLLVWLLLFTLLLRT